MSTIVLWLIGLAIVAAIWAGIVYVWAPGSTVAFLGGVIVGGVYSIGFYIWRAR